MENFLKNDILDINYINRIKEIDGGETFSELVNMSEVLFPEYIEELILALNTTDSNNIETLVHKIKGGAATVGAFRMANLVVTIHSNSQTPGYDLDGDLKTLKMLASASINELHSLI